VEWARENFDAALEHFEQAVDLNVLPDAQHFGLMYQIAQLYFMQGRYAEALDRLELWFCKAPPGDVTAHAHVLSASIHAQMGNHGAVLKAIDIAIAMEADPRESWYQLKLAAHYELRQYRPAAGTLEVMIDRWPEKKTYWRQLSQIHVTLENEDRALAVMALAYRNGLLDEASDITYLSSLYSHHDIPYKAAQVLEAGIRDGVVEADSQHWTRVADGWYAADEVEKALAAYAEAGKLADDGNLDLRRGYLLVDLERWPEADEALGRALAKGGLNEQKTGEALLLRGMTRFALGRHDAAAEDWARAGTYERTRDSARQWMNYLREERRRNSS
jgi:tetratricopeptide (TPR) repeat protein